MKKKLLVLLFSLAALALVACGGGNDVASSGASAVSAAVAPTPDANTAITQSTTTAAKQTNEPKVNGQVDERTGVAPMAAQMTIGGTCSYNGITNVQVGLPCSLKGCLAGFPAPSNSPCWNALLNATPIQCTDRIIFMGGDLELYSEQLAATGFCNGSGSP